MVPAKNIGQLDFPNKYHGMPPGPTEAGPPWHRDEALLAAHLLGRVTCAWDYGPCGLPRIISRAALRSAKRHGNPACLLRARVHWLGAGDEART